MGKKKKLFCILMLVVIDVFFFTGFIRASGSASENYAIPASVFSGGGEAMESSNFVASGTIGQPSPLLDPASPPDSSNYELYPGFWYTLEAVAECGNLASFAATFGRVEGEPGYSSMCDSEPEDEPDGDVDGLDLADYAERY